MDASIGVQLDSAFTLKQMLNSSFAFHAICAGWITFILLAGYLYLQIVFKRVRGMLSRAVQLY